MDGDHSAAIEELNITMHDLEEACESCGKRFDGTTEVWV